MITGLLQHFRHLFYHALTKGLILFLIDSWFLFKWSLAFNQAHSYVKVQNCFVFLLVFRRLPQRQIVFVDSADKITLLEEFSCLIFSFHARLQ